jgi:CSLREA domain-containing protein
MSANGSLGSRRSFSLFRVLSIFLANCIWVAPLLLAPAAAAYGSDTYTVTVNTDDYGGTPTTLTGTASHCPANGTGSTCTLRDAITAANADPGSTIKFTVTGTNTLNFVLPTIITSTTIAGPGANVLTISGGYQPFSFYGGTVTATVSGLTIANVSNTIVATGLAPAYGGGMYNDGANVTVSLVVFSNNTTGYSALPGEGGAILNNQGVLTVSDCTFVGNSVQNNGYGGAITNIGTLKVTGSTFNGNSASTGSAIYSLSGLSIANSTFTDNHATILSGAVTFTSGTLTVANSTFVGNTAAFGPNEGTSLYNDGNPPSAPASMIVTNSLLDAPATGAACVTTATPSDCPVSGTNGNVVEALSTLNLASLGYYGGPTETFLPMPGSPVHCASPSTTFPGTDQRGFEGDLSCGAGLVDSGSVQANYLTVDTTADDPGTAATSCGANCTLRDAISTALTAGNGDIDFASGVTGSIVLGATLPTIDTTGSVNIAGPGANLLSVSGASQVFDITGGTVDLSGLTIGGKTTASGGGISNTGGLLTLSNMVLNANSATVNGGGIDNGGTLLVSDSTFSGNNAASGSAIYNTGVVKMSYSTVADNKATTSGGIYNGNGATLIVANSTFASNTGTGGGIFNSGALAITNSILDAAAECSGTGCPATSGSGNVVGATKLAGLGSYGGTTPTILPQPGSSAICGGTVALIPTLVTNDQRGFANENITYAGYSATAPCIDAGAVQTNYTSVQFAGVGPYVGNANTPGTAPPMIVSVTENGQNIGGVPVTLAFSGTGTASGLTSTTVAGTGATFSSLDVNTASASGDTLSVSMPVVGAETLTASPVDLTVKPQGAATTTATGSAAATTLSTSVNLSATIMSGGKAVTEGQVSFTVQYSSGVVPTVTGTVNSSGVATVSYLLPQHLAATTYSIAVSYSDIGGSFAPSSTAGQLAISKVTPTVATWPAASPITYGQTLASSLLTGGSASVAGSFAFTTPTTVPSSGTSSQSVTFTPTDAVDYTTVTGSVSVTVNGTPTPIVPYIQVNGGNWQTAASVTVQATDLVNLGPQPLTGGSWSWTGPNGYSSTARQINSIPLTLPTNVFVATYTNPAGVKSTLNFTITVAPTSITPYVEVNGGAWQSITGVTVQATDLVNLGPQPLTGGSWSWTGPNGYTSTSRQINSVPLTSPTNVFIATYTNPAGVKSTQTFTIIVAPTSITPYIQVNNGNWATTNSTIVLIPGSSVNLGPQPLTGGSWSWTGPNGYTSTSRQINNIPLSFGIDAFVATYTNPAGVKSTETFTIIVL